MRTLCLFLIVPVLASGQPDADWAYYNKDPQGTRYSKLNQINKSNVTSLQVAWRYHTGNADDQLKTTIECNPLIINGTMYITSPVLEVIALNGATGRELWRYNPFPAEASGSTARRIFLTTAGALLTFAVACSLRLSRSRRHRYQFAALILMSGALLTGFRSSLTHDARREERRLGPNRGLTYWSHGADHRIYFAGGHRLVALNADTGRPILSFGDAGTVDITNGLGKSVEGMIYTVTSPGVIYHDLIVLGSKVGEGPLPAAPGHVRAFDIHTGRQRWIFRTIPRHGDPGSETWPPQALETAGGANAWAGMTVDENRGIVYVATGSPTFDLYGGDRSGSNLFGDSLVALRAETGEMLWYYQIVHHDLWDYDLPTPPTLVTLRKDGTEVDAAVQLGKNGYVYVFNRVTGEPIFPIVERPVPASDMPGETAAPTQPIPLKPPPLSRTTVSESDLSEISPSAHELALRLFGKARSTGIYTPPRQTLTIVTPGFHGGSNWSGASWDPVRRLLVANSNDIPYLLQMLPSRFWAHYPFRFTGFNRFIDSEGYPLTKPPWGRLTAIDLDRGEFVWQVPLGEYPELTARGIPTTGVENVGGSIITGGGLIFIAATRDEKFRAFDINNGRILWQTQLSAAGYATPSTYSVNGKQYLVIAAGGQGMIQTRAGDEYIAFALPDS